MPYEILKNVPKTTSKNCNIVKLCVFVIHRLISENEKVPLQNSCVVAIISDFKYLSIDHSEVIQVPQCHWMGLS